MVGEKKHNTFLGGCFALVAFGAVGAWAETPSNPQSDPIIDQGLFEFSVAYELRDKCDRVSARPFRVFFFYQRVYSHARNIGFSKDAMDTHVEDKSNQAGMQARVDAYLQDNGVDLDQAATYCALARDQIQVESEIGKLLRIR